MTPDPDTTYARLAQGLQDSPLNVSPAEAHGLLCGLLCGGVPDAEARWVREVFGNETGLDHDPDMDEDEDALVLEDLPPALRLMARETRAQFAGADLALSLVLPAEEAPLRERAEGIYDWTRGLLLGLGLAGLKAEDLSDQGRELLDDLLAITRLDLDSLTSASVEKGPGHGAENGAESSLGDDADGEAEEDESALMELREFLWVAVRLLHEEMGPARS